MDSTSDEDYMYMYQLEGQSFTQLQEDIDNTENTLILEDNYVFNEIKDENLVNGVTIRNPITIDGNGHTINALNIARIFVISADNVTIKNINLKHGYTTEYGGALYWKNQNGILENSNLTYNLADYGGAVAITDNNIIINNNNFSHNYANYEGGAIYADATGIKITNNNFLSNEATVSGYAIGITRESIVSYENNTFINNSEFNPGGEYEENPEENANDKRLRGKLTTLVTTIEKSKIDAFDTISSQYTTIELKNNQLTLGILNQLFNKKFINCLLLVYVNGKLVFNDTVKDDLSMIIMDLIKLTTGDHEIKVEFTDNEGKSESYTEKITIN